MILHDETGEPVTASVNGAPPSSFRQRLVTFRIANDDDMTELSKEMTKGRDVIMQIPAQGCSYVQIRELIPTKLHLSPPSTRGKL